MKLIEILKGRYIVMDVDGTITTNPNPYLTIAEELGVRNLVVEMVNDYLSGDITYKSLVKKEVNIFNEKAHEMFQSGGLLKGHVEGMLGSPILQEDTESIFKVIQRVSKDYIFLSSGFYFFCNKAISMLGVKNESIKQKLYANQIQWGNNNILKGIKINVEADKVQAIDKIANDRGIQIKDVTYIGDNEFDNKIIKYVVDNGGDVIFLNNEQVLAKTISYNTVGNIYAFNQKLSEILR